MKEFEKIVEQIFEYTHEYAVKNLNLKLDNPISSWTDEETNKFTEYVHIGFKKAQELVLNELLNYETQIEELNKTLKESKRNRNKIVEEDTQKSINIIKYKTKTLRMFMDFIAWQFLGGQYYKVRRFYDMRKKDNSRPILSKSNIESVKNAVEYYHSLNPLNFALISDLTSFIDIGDMLVMDNHQLVPIEVKEGQKNKEIFDFLFKEKIPDNLGTIDENFLKQAKRILNQAKRGHLLYDVLKNEKGVDPFTELKTKVNKEAFEIKTYIDEFEKLIANLDVENYSYTIIEDIISIGIYQNEVIHMGDILIPFLNNEMFGKAYPVFNYREKFQMPISEPIFYYGLSKKTIFDILFGRINIVMSINLDKFIELCNLQGLEARYLSEKETRRRKSQGEIPLFEFEKKNIMIGDTILGDGLIARMLFDFVRPSSIIEYFKQN